MNLQKFGKRFLRKKELMRKLLSLILPKMVTSLVFKVVESSFITIKRTGGAEVVDWILHQLGIRVVQTLKYFMILVKKTTTLALEKLILQVIAVDLWRSVTRCLCSIAVSRMALLNLLSTRMLILVVGWNESPRPKLTTRMFSKLA